MAQEVGERETAPSMATPGFRIEPDRLERPPPIPASSFRRGSTKEKWLAKHKP